MCLPKKPLKVCCQGVWVDPRSRTCVEVSLGASRADKDSGSTVASSPRRTCGQSEGQQGLLLPKPPSPTSHFPSSLGYRHIESIMYWMHWRSEQTLPISAGRQTDRQTDRQAAAEASFSCWLASRSHDHVSIHHHLSPYFVSRHIDDPGARPWRHGRPIFLLRTYCTSASDNPNFHQSIVCRLTSNAAKGQPTMTSVMLAHCMQGTCDREPAGLRVGMQLCLVQKQTQCIALNNLLVSS